MFEKKTYFVKKIKMRNYTTIQKAGLILGPILFTLIYFGIITIINPVADKVIAIAAWMIIWWITEATNIAVTALLPLTLFPLLGIMTLKEVTPNYASPMIYLFFGGFVIALALEKVNLHKRIALSILKLTGTNANGIILGFMISTALMSMWISNTASTVVMLPIAISVIKLLIDDEDGFTKGDKNFALSIMLGIAFSANIGGTATLVGTPPTVFVLGYLQNSHNITIGFFQWMQLGVPFAILMIALSYFVLVKIIYPNHLGNIKSSGNIIQNEYDKLGKISHGEKVVLVIFLLTALSWIFRSKINQIFPDLKLTDTTISMIAAVAMFVFPLNFKEGKFALDWEDTSKLPWGILILFGGGLALAAGLADAGLIKMIGDYISNKETWSVILITSILVTLMLFMTELMGNLALVTILIPLIAGVATGLNVPILNMIIPATIAASCAFMLPMATPPNAIVFASGHIKVAEMAKAGFVLNVLATLILIGVAYYIVPLLF